MKSTSLGMLSSAIVLAISNSVYAQYTPPPPPKPTPGLINEWLRKDDPYMASWDIGGSLRLRIEDKDNAGFTRGSTGANGAIFDFRDKLPAGADNENMYFLERLRVRVGYTDKWWSALVEGRQSSTTGDERHPNAESDGPIDLHQAFITLGNHKEFPLSLKVGRQEMVYGDERLVGAFAWNNIGRVFDAAKLRWQNEYFGADFFTSRVVIPDDNNFNVANDYDWFSGVYASTKLIPKQTTEVYFLSRNTAPGSTTAIKAPIQVAQPAARDIYTVGVRMKSNPGEFGGFDYTGELMGQFGHFNDTRKAAGTQSLEHQAWAMALNGGYTWTEAFGTPRLAIEYCYASGDSNPTDGKHETFENLFPTNHKFYGHMDVVSLQNINDIALLYSIKPHPRLSLGAEYHALLLANTSDNFYNVAGAPRGGLATTPGTGYGINPSYGNYVGSELVFTAGFAATKFLQLEGSFGHFFVGDYIKQTFSSPTAGSKDANWAYLQATFTF